MRAERPRAAGDARSSEVHGAVLVTGPTGAGKTTTLYAALRRDQHARPDPDHDRGPGRVRARRRQAGPGQPEGGLTFAAGLRSMIRSDPDVLMVGEIRDRETAQIAIESALTGHLVLSTLHTNDAPMAPARLDRDGDRAVPRRHRRSSAWSPSASPAGSARTAGARSRFSAEELRRATASTSPRRRSTPTSRSAACAAAAPAIAAAIGIYEVMVVSEAIRSLILEQGFGRRDRGGRRWRRGCAGCARTASRRCARGSPRSPRCCASSGPETTARSLSPRRRNSPATDRSPVL